MPLDPEPVHFDTPVPGLFVLRQGFAGAGAPLAVAVTPGFLEGSEDAAYVSHFATCPDAPSWRRHG